MAHELRNLPNLTYEELTPYVFIGLVSAAVLVGLFSHLASKQRRKGPGPPTPPAKPRAKKRRKRR